MTDPAKRGLLLDIGGVVMANSVEVVARLARREPALAALVDPMGGLGGPGDELWHQMLRREVTERAYWSVRAEQVGRALGARWTTYDMIHTLYAGPQTEWLRFDVVDLMRDAVAAGIPLGALTNDLADFHGQDWVDQQDFLRLFQSIVDASHTGVMKPAPEAFAAGAASLGLSPEQVVYLDDMPWNVEGALRAGLDAHQVSYDEPHLAVDWARRRLGLGVTTADSSRA